MKKLKLEIIDTPGVYGISSFNDEERATRDLALEADIVVNVASALSLDRDLFLTKQLCDLGKPMILVVNQLDEARSRKLEIDLYTLSEELGIEVIGSIATKKERTWRTKKHSFIPFPKTIFSKRISN